MSSTAPLCVLCEEVIEPGEPFKPVMAYTRAAVALPGKRGGAGRGEDQPMRLVNRGVHYACELDAVAAAAATRGDDAPEIMVDDGGEPGDLRDNLRRLMRKAVAFVDVLDELL